MSDSDCLFFQIVAEFWLNQNSLEVDRTVSNQTLVGYW